MEYLVVCNSFAAPIVSDESKYFIEADSPEQARAIMKKKYSHPCGLFALGVYADSADFLKGKKPLLTYVTPKAKKKMKDDGRST